MRAAHYNCAISHERLSNIEAANPDYHAALAIDPSLNRSERQLKCFNVCQPQMGCVRDSGSCPRATAPEYAEKRGFRWSPVDGGASLAPGLHPFCGVG